MLSAYLTAHAEAQLRTHNILANDASQGEEGVSKEERVFLSEVNAVSHESRVLMGIARRYLEGLQTLALGGESLSELMRGLRARRTALEIVSRIQNYIHLLAQDGSIEHAEGEKLMHDLQHDVDSLRNHSIAPTIDGTGGSSMHRLPVPEVAAFMLGFRQLHSEAEKTLVDQVSQEK